MVDPGAHYPLTAVDPGAYYPLAAVDPGTHYPLQRPVLVHIAPTAVDPGA
jgi:hypothetical protein